ncbi:MAG TPA: condensation domain-containing protein, partial [Hyphomicrobiales bacterium]|nr:condensation domain-containing protein [Hyphomicrobiales bacterium]
MLDLQPHQIKDLVSRIGSLDHRKRSQLFDKLASAGVSILRLPIVRAESRGAVPASYAQQRQWVLWQLAPESAAYHISTTLRLQGTLDNRALRQSFALVVARHEVLRTHFTEQEGELCQVIAEELALPLVEETLVLQAGESEEAALHRCLRTHEQTPFDLTTGPLLRLTLIQLEQEDHVLSLVQHHIISDEWSMQLLVEEVVSAYQAFSQGLVPALAPLSIQYADYALWQRQILNAAEGSRQLAYWREQLGDEQPVLELPTDHPRPPQPSYHGASVVRALPAELRKQVASTAARLGLTPFMLLLASFQLLLHRYSRQSDIRVGVPIANRNRLETERLIGFFVNTQVLRAQVTPQLTVVELLKQVKRSALDAQAHQDLPFERLVDALQPERSLSTTPLFQVMFNYQRAQRGNETFLAGLQQQGLRVSGVVGEQASAQFDLVLNLSEGEGEGEDGLNASFNYATDLFERETIERMAAHWQRLLKGMLDNPEQRIDELPLLDEVERSQLLSGWNNTAAVQ